jgi:hypothetical protein
MILDETHTPILYLHEYNQYGCKGLGLLVKTRVDLRSPRTQDIQFDFGNTLVSHRTDIVADGIALAVAFVSEPASELA